MCCCPLLSLCLELLFPHSSMGIRMSNGIINELDKLLSNIKINKFNFNTWRPSIKYSTNIVNILTKKLRNSLKNNNIEMSSMNGNKEDYFELQISVYLYKIILSYFTEKMNIIFKTTELESSIIYYKVPQNILDSIENDYMDSFRNYIVKLKTHDLNIDSTDNAEKVILQEKLDIIITNIIVEQIDTDDIISKIEQEYSNIKHMENDKLVNLRNNV